MSPLRMFGKRWNISTDDLVYPSLLELIIQSFMFIIYFSYFNIFEISLICHISLFYEISHFGLGILILCNIIMNLTLMILSAQGSIIEEARRTRVPICIYLKLFFAMNEIIFSILCFALNFILKINFDVCNKQAFMSTKIIFITSILLLVIYVLSFYINYDETENDKNGIKKLIWKKRLKCLLCIFNPNEEEEKALESAVNILLEFDQDENLVYSDYMAGIQLMYLHDKYMDNLRDFLLHIFDQDYLLPSINKGKENLEEKKNPVLKTSNLYQCHNQESKEIHSCLNLQSGINGSENKMENMSNWRDLRFIYYFSTMAKASYGWPLHLLFPDKDKSLLNVCLGLCCSHLTSCCCSDCICCRIESSNSRDKLIVFSEEKFCNCHKKAILHETTLKNESLICVSFYNKLHHSPFFIAISHEIESIIISIRGTFSLNDILTDMNAKLTALDEYDLVGCCAHYGFAKAALNIRKILTQDNIIHKLVHDNKNYRVIFTGHSLGAGIAIILSCLYHFEFPNLKCYAFGPPLGTVNGKMAEYCKNFVLTIVNGYEWVPRTSLTTLYAAKIRLVNYLQNYSHSKFQLSAQHLFPCKCLKCKTLVNSKMNILNVYQRDSTFLTDNEMNTKLPGQIINIVNIKSILESKKSLKDKCTYTMIITSSQQFNTIIFHPKMFTDHFPNKVVDNLHKILKFNKLFSMRHHPHLQHFWAENETNDIMKLPCLFNLKRESLLSDHHLQFTSCIHNDKANRSNLNIQNTLVISANINDNSQVTSMLTCV